MYNEVGNVEAIYEAIHRVFDPENIPIELVMVNDGSSDGTREALFDLYQKKAEDKGLVIVGFSRNFGKEAAILSGMKHATGDYVCFIDADLQQSPEVALSMYKKLEEDPDLDCVAAFQEARKESKILTFFKDTFYSLINYFSDTRFVKGASDFRMCRRNMVDAILSLPEYQRFSKGIFSWVGFRSEFIPYEVQERNSGTTKWSFMKLFKYAIDGIVSYSTTPLRIPFVCGVCATAISLIWLLVLLIRYLIPGIFVSGVQLILAFILLLGGIQMIFIGFLGEYLSRTYLQGKGRPVFIEKEIWERKEDGKEYNE